MLWLSLTTLIPLVAVNALTTACGKLPVKTSFILQPSRFKLQIHRERQQQYQFRIFLATDGKDEEGTSDFSAPEEDLITREMFMQHMLGETSSSDSFLEEQSSNVKIKKKKNQKGGFKEYKVYDNRDSLPFAVKLTTPDPYTHPDVKKQNIKKAKKRANAIEEQITSKILLPRPKSGVNSDEADDNNFMTVLGEYNLDKHTTTGDTLLINNIEYKVLKHRCLYKYAGGQRFVMIKKFWTSKR
jgi:hypothetical protein